MMSAKKGAFLNYTEKAMLSAVKDVQLHKTPIRTAAKKFGVPRITLTNKVKWKSPMERKMGPASILIPEEEHKICEWVQNTAKAGFPVTTEQLIVSVEKYLKDIERPCALFKNGRPGRTWLKAFIRRNPTISTRISQNLTASRARVTDAELSEWYKRVYKELEDSGHADILNDASRIFNCDETAFFLAPKGPKVLARKGEKNVYQQVNTDDKECLTVLVTGNANGSLAPTTVLFSYKRIPQEIADNFPSDWGIGKTDSGWMTCEAFFEFIADIFYPWLIKNKIALPVILFVDGHISHLSLQTSQFCEEKGIVLIALYPNATHLIQPMDVAVFKPLKEAWRRHVQNWRIDRIKNDEPHILKKKDFAKLLHEVMGNTINKSILANGFKKCGLFPWNPMEVKVSHESNRKNQDISEQIYYLKRGLKFLNDTIDPEKLEKFEATLDEWSGDLVDLSLFNVWKKTKDELKKLQLDQINDSTNDEGSNLLHVITAENMLSSEQLASASNNNDSFFKTAMETSATAVPIAISDDLLVTIPGSPAISVDDGIFETTLDQFDIIAPNDMLEIVPQPSTSAVADGLNSGIDSVASTSFHVIPDNVPSPFKKHFFYKTNITKNTPKSRTKEKIPTIVSGKSYQEYLQKKLKQKEDLELIKVEKAAEKLRKKEEKESLKRIKTLKKNNSIQTKRVKKNLRFSLSSSDSDVVVSLGESVNETENEIDQDFDIVGLKPPQKVDGEFVIFKYDNNFYPGKVLKATKKTATISSMKANGRLWKWPEQIDVLVYPWEAVVAHIDEPMKTSSTRNVFDVPEIHSFI